jgi:predicted RNA-binding Zn-ribbon protein involved in translation (DUF1610 family)
MPLKSLVSHVKLTQYSSYDQHATILERCPACHNEKIVQTPRRGPAMFHCRKCGFVANLDDINNMHWLLGQRAS